MDDVGWLGLSGADDGNSGEGRGGEVARLDTDERVWHPKEPWNAVTVVCKRPAGRVARQRRFRALRAARRAALASGFQRRQGEGPRRGRRAGPPGSSSHPEDVDLVPRRPHALCHEEVERLRADARRVARDLERQLPVYRPHGVGSRRRRREGARRGRERGRRDGPDGAAGRRWRGLRLDAPARGGDARCH